MNTTIITPNQTHTIIQYGLRMPDGTELWAAGTLSVGSTVENRSDGKSLKYLNSGHFTDVNLQALGGVIAPADVENGSARVSNKETAIERFYRAAGNLTRAAGICESDYVNSVKILRRELVVVTGQTQAVNVPDESWEPSDDETKAKEVSNA